VCADGVAGLISICFDSLRMIRVYKFPAWELAFKFGMLERCFFPFIYVTVDNEAFENVAHFRHLETTLTN
jgi:hypothetical protein